MTKKTNAATQPSAPKTPTTQKAVQRVQSRTAPKNKGHQADWTRRLQSAADKQA